MSTKLKKSADIFVPEGTKMRDKLPLLKKTNVSESNYTYCNGFTSQLSITLFKPILKAIEERNQSKLSFIKEINSNGLNYSYSGFVSTAKGKNPFIKNFGYFIKLYEYLNLPFPSLEYLNSFD